MLFMATFEFDPANYSKVVQRRLEKGAMDPAGANLLGEWSYAGGGKVFRLMEINDAMDFMASASAWADLGKIEIYPVVETEKALASLKSAPAR